MKVTEYFDGNVTSIAFENSEGRATSGVMAPGEYEFGTGETERMKVVSGKMEAKLPGEPGYRAYPAGTEFNVDANVKFNVRVSEMTAYLCFYGE